MTGIGIFRIIISKFYPKKEPSPIFLFVIDKNFEKSLHHIVLTFALAISLRIQRSREFLHNFKEVAK